MPDRKATEDGEVISDPEVVRELAEGTPVYYTNSVNILIGPYDVSLTLYQLREASSERVIFDSLARVVMSPQHAKVLAELLSEKVAQYERTYGSLPTQEVMGTRVREEIARIDASDEETESATENE